MTRRSMPSTTERIATMRHRVARPNVRATSDLGEATLSTEVAATRGFCPAALGESSPQSPAPWPSPSPARRTPCRTPCRIPLRIPRRIPRAGFSLGSCRRVEMRKAAPPRDDAGKRAPRRIQHHTGSANASR